MIKLHNNYNIKGQALKKTVLISLALIFIGCSDNKVDDSKNNLTHQKQKETVKPTNTKNSESVQIKKVSEAEDNKNKIDTELKKVLDTPTVASIKSGKDIYHSCAACHGQNAEKEALGKSKIIRGWSASRTEAALNGYIDGSYGGTLKGLMKGQSAVLSEDEIKSVSEYISKL